MQSVAGIVALGFIFLALVSAFVVSHGLQWLFLTLGVVDTPIVGDNFTTSTLIGAVLSFGIAFFCWRSPRLNTLAQEVVQELKKVTWPSGAETRMATVVVVVTSFVVSMVLGFFDLGFNWIIERIF